MSDLIRRYPDLLFPVRLTAKTGTAPILYSGIEQQITGTGGYEDVPGGREFDATNNFLHALNNVDMDVSDTPTVLCRFRGADEDGKLVTEIVSGLAGVSSASCTTTYVSCVFIDFVGQTYTVAYEKKNTGTCVVLDRWCVTDPVDECCAISVCGYTVPRKLCAVFTGPACVSGYTIALEWNGSSWAPVAGQLPSPLGVCADCDGNSTDVSNLGVYNSGCQWFFTFTGPCGTCSYLIGDGSPAGPGSCCTSTSLISTSPLHLRFVLDNFTCCSPATWPGGAVTVDVVEGECFGEGSGSGGGIDPIGDGIDTGCCANVPTVLDCLTTAETGSSCPCNYTGINLFWDALTSVWDSGTFLCGVSGAKEQRLVLACPGGSDNPADFVLDVYCDGVLTDQVTCESGICDPLSLQFTFDPDCSPSCDGSTTIVITGPA